jgi:hypothetical protein
MMELKGRLDQVADREKWAARGASFVAKLKATKLVWFPPRPVEDGTAAVTAAKKTTARAAKKSTSAARKTANGTSKRTSGAAKKTSGAAKKTSQAARAGKA